MNLAQLIDGESVIEGRMRALYSRSSSAIASLIEPPALPVIVATRRHDLADRMAESEGDRELREIERALEIEATRGKREAAAKARAETYVAKVRQKTAQRAEAAAAKLREKEPSKQARRVERAAEKARKLAARKAAAAARLVRKAARLKPQRPGATVKAYPPIRRASRVTLQQSILQALKGGKMSIPELHAVIGCNLDSLYTIVSNMRSRGIITADGVRRHRKHALPKAKGRAK